MFLEGLLPSIGKIDQQEAQRLTSLFLEVIIAPDYTTEALKIFEKKKNLRILKLTCTDSSVLKTKNEKGQDIHIKTIHGGFLLQSKDFLENMESWEFIGEKPSEDLMKTLLFAWKVVMEAKK